MNCEQKSGVFLNLNCERTATNTCENCKKKICATHFRMHNAAELCVDCYWEKYLYAEEKKEELYQDDTYTPAPMDTTGTTDDSTFQGGFGGGGFGGGGASGAWTEGDAAGFNETNTDGGLLDTDDTFYYS